MIVVIIARMIMIGETRRTSMYFFTILYTYPVVENSWNKETNDGDVLYKHQVPEKKVKEPVTSIILYFFGEPHVLSFFFVSGNKSYYERKREKNEVN